MTTATVGPSAASTPSVKQAKGAAQLFHRLRRQPVTLAAMITVALIILVAVFAPVLAPYAPDETDFTAVLTGPTSDHPLGTDDLGRDILSQLIYAARTALIVAGGSVAVAMLIGVPFGLILGYKGGWYDRLGSRVMDIADALPGIMIGFVVIAVLGRGTLILIFAIGLIFSMNFGRMVRAVTLSERKKLYVESATVTGLRNREIVFRQVLPNLAGPLAVQGAVFLGNAIKVEAALSFLGLGLPDDQPSWGGMLRLAAEHQVDHPFMALPPGIAIVVTVLAFNLLGDGINDALSGRRTSRKRRGRAALATETLASVEAAKQAAIARGQSGESATGVRVSEPGTSTPAEGVQTTERHPDAVLEVRNATIVAERPDGTDLPLVTDVSLTVGRGEVMGLLGESGSGKSMLAKSILGLLPSGVRLDAGSVRLGDLELAGASDKELRSVRGSKLGVVFQNPQANLSPVHTVGHQLIDPLRIHHGFTKSQARSRAIELLDMVGVKDAAGRIDDYPYQFSGGMAQRVAIAIALSGDPDVLIMDEATSALDVTTQSQVLDLVLDLRERFDMSIINITHDLGVAAESCDRVAVMYRGQLIEIGSVFDLFDRPEHPYTAALLAAHPTADRELDRLPTLADFRTADGEWIRK